MRIKNKVIFSLLEGFLLTLLAVTIAFSQPRSDVRGKDISGIPRYPGSVRSYYGPVPGVPGSIVVEYLTSASVNKVADFYKTKLPVNGWTISDIGEEILVAYKKGRGTAAVSVKASEDYPGYTKINISILSK